MEDRVPPIWGMGYTVGQVVLLGTGRPKNGFLHSIGPSG